MDTGTALPDGLLAAVRLRLHITWQDEATDTDLSEILMQGITYLNRTAGETLDFSEPGTAWRALLFEYARYARSEALEVFETNYRSSLLALQHDRKIARMSAEETEGGGDNAENPVPAGE